MLRCKIRLFTLTLLCSAALAPRAEATPVIIDSFDTPFLATTDAGALDNLYSSVSDGGGYVSSRQVRVDSGDIQATAGDLIVSDDSDVGVIAQLIWPDPDTSVLDSNLVNGDNSVFALEISSVDTSTAWFASLVADDGTHSFSADFDPINGPGTYHLLFSVFTSQSVDLDMIDQLRLVLVSLGASTDTITVAEFRAVPEPGSANAVPEPGSAALVALGLFALGATNPRRRVTA